MENELVEKSVRSYYSNVNKRCGSNQDGGLQTRVVVWEREIWELLAHRWYLKLLEV